MTAKHTPGPWEIGRSAKMSEAKGGNCVATVFPKGNRGDRKTSIRITMVEDDGNTEETDANARLIAKSPEMKALLEEWESSGYGNSVLCPVDGKKCVRCRTQALLASLFLRR